jgi:hypothetical protein
LEAAAQAVIQTRQAMWRVIQETQAGLTIFIRQAAVAVLFNTRQE